MADKLEKLLQICQTTSSNSTHVRKTNNRVTKHYNIPDERMDQFVRYYNRTVSSNKNPHLMELSREIGPVTCCLEFKQGDLDERIYELENIQQVVSSYFTVISEHLEVTEEQLQCFVLEKFEPENHDNNHYDGFNILFPFISVTIDTQLMLRNKMIDEVKQYDFFAGCQHTDKSAIVKPVFMCGSGDQYPFNITHIYNQDMEEISQDTYPTNELIEYLSIRRDTEENLSQLKDTQGPLLSVDMDDIRTQLTNLLTQIQSKVPDMTEQECEQWYGKLTQTTETIEPDKQGQRWTEEEDQQLLDEIERKLSVRTIAQIHSRTEGGVLTHISKMVKDMGKEQSTDEIMDTIHLPEHVIEAIMQGSRKIRSFIREHLS